MSFWVVGTMVAATAVSAYGQSEATKAQGREAVRQGNLAQTERFIDEEMRLVEADQIEDAAVAQALNIKRQALTMRAGLASAQGASGAVIGEGSAQAAMDQIDTLASADVLAALYSGSDQAVATRQQGRMSGQAGRNAAESGALAGASLGNAAQWQIVGGLAQAAAAGAQGYGRYQSGLNTGGKK